jgi:hypothetical protein
VAVQVSRNETKSGRARFPCNSPSPSRNSRRGRAATSTRKSLMDGGELRAGWQLLEACVGATLPGTSLFRATDHAVRRRNGRRAAQAVLWCAQRPLLPASTNCGTIPHRASADQPPYHATGRRTAAVGVDAWRRERFSGSQLWCWACAQRPLRPQRARVQPCRHTRCADSASEPPR